MNRLLRGAVAGLMLLVAAAAPAAAYDDFGGDPSAQGTGARFTVAVLPDTQFYSRYADPAGDKYTPRWGSEPFAAQTEWLVKNREAYNIAFTTHLGDLVDQAEKPGQWQIADRDMKVLENARMPYSVLAGNHDVTAGNDTYLKTFSPQRAAAQATFGQRSPSGMSEFHTFTAEGQEFLVLAISWEGHDDLAWAEQVLASHPRTPTILTSHQILNITADGKPLDTDFGTVLWDRLISKHDQVFLTLNGHHHGATQRVKKNAAGHDVVQVLMDYQMAFAGGNGDMGLIEFDLTHGRLTGTGFSPWVLRKPKPTLIPEFDRALLEGPGDAYSLPFDFRSRFAGITTTGTQPSLTAKLRRDLMAQYANPPVVAPRPAADAEDYPHVDGTLAHWRMDPARFVDGKVLEDGQPVPAGGRVVDISGHGADMRREPVGTMTTTGTVDDAVFSADHHPYSAGLASVCLPHATRDHNRASWFRTPDGAPINTEKFPRGYTIETFVKLPSDFTADKNRWMVALGRSGDRVLIDPKAQVEGGEPPMALAVSNLREVQWSFMSTSRPAGGWADGSAWSGDVDTERWFHLAVTNDPATNETVLHVNGAPMLRSVSGLSGLDAALDSYWTLGASSNGTAVENGWRGCVGETRVVDHPIAPEQWLTARAAMPTPTPRPVPSVTPTGSPRPVPSGTPTPAPTAPAPKESTGGLASTAR